MNTERQNLASGSPWEDIVGYSRAVKIGSFIEISGTVAVDSEGKVVGKGDPYAQMSFILKKISLVLEELGSSLKDVIRTRMFVTDINQWELIGKAHGEVFDQIKPATSMIEVKGLIGSDYLVEVEVSAFIHKGT